ncbi:MarR family transcriptional regulator [Kitasatospora arboriphila]
MATTASTTAPSTADLMESMAAVGAAYFQDFAAAAARHGLSSSQAKALKAVQEPVPMRALARPARLRRLQRHRHRRPAGGARPRPPRGRGSDRRVKIVGITGQGREVLDLIRADMVRTHEAFASLDAEQRTALQELCRQVLPLLAER